MFQKLKSILSNYFSGISHWSYSFSCALFIAGILLFVFSILAHSSCVAILSGFIITFGLLFLPNFKSSYIDIFAKGMMKFVASTFATVADILLIQHIVINLRKHQNIQLYKYIIFTLLTFFITRYYIDVMYHVISTIIKGANKKADTIKKVWKIILTLVGFLVSLATLTNIAINIVNVISNAT